MPAYIDAKHTDAHNKIMVIDSHIILTESFNFTRAAEESNVENLLVIEDATLAKNIPTTGKGIWRTRTNMKGSDTRISRHVQGIPQFAFYLWRSVANGLFPSPKVF